MNCQEITKVIETLSVKKKSFDIAMNQDSLRIDEALGIKEFVENLTCIDKVFLRDLEDKRGEIISDLKAYIDKLDDDDREEGEMLIPEIMARIASRFNRENLPAIKLNSKYYKRFLKEYLRSRFYADIVKLADKYSFGSEVKGDMKTIFAQIVNTIFLNLGCDGEKIIINDIPKPLSDYFVIGLDNPRADLQVVKAGNFFGAIMKNGSLKAVEAGDSAGISMTGGKIIIDHAGEGCGTSMKGGELVVLEAGDNFCSSMDGGKAKANKIGDRAFTYMHGGSGYVEKAGEDCCRGMKNGFVYFDEAVGFGAIEGGEVLADKFETTADDRHPLSLEDNSLVPKYITPDGTGLVELSGDNEIFYSSLIQHKDQNSFIITADAELKDTNPTAGLQRNLIVLRQRVDNIGYLMTGGAIVLEIEDLTIEEAKSLISKDKTGGLILMRVADPENPGKTKLIDLE